MTMIPVYMLLGVTGSMAVTQKPKADVARDHKAGISSSLARIFLTQLDNLNNHTDKQGKPGA